MRQWLLASIALGFSSFALAQNLPSKPDLSGKWSYTVNKQGKPDFVPHFTLQQTPDGIKLFYLNPGGVADGMVIYEGHFTGPNILAGKSLLPKGANGQLIWIDEQVKLEDADHLLFTGQGTTVYRVPPGTMPQLSPPPQMGGGFGLLADLANMLIDQASDNSLAGKVIDLRQKLESDGEKCEHPSQRTNGESKNEACDSRDRDRDNLTAGYRDLADEADGLKQQLKRLSADCSAKKQDACQQLGPLNDQLQKDEDALARGSMPFF